MATAGRSMAATFAPVAALLTGIGFLLTGHGLLLTIVPLRAEAEAFTRIEIGLLGSAYYLGFVLGCLAAPYVILRAGHIRAFAAMIALGVVSTLTLLLAVQFGVWIGARIVFGVCLAGLYLVIESWLNDRATNQTRGLIMSSYIVVNFAAITVGQFLVTIQPPTSHVPFVIGAILLALATLPVAVTRSAQPAPITLFRFRPGEIYRRSPVGIVGVTVIGLTNGSFWALAAVYATGRGLTVDEAAAFVSVAVVGAAILQWPVGRLSDRMDRRLVLAGLLVAATVFGLVLAFVPLGRWALYVVGFLLGATLLPAYSIAAAHAYDLSDPKRLVETSAGILLANGIGSACGPILAALAMGAIGPGGLFAFTAAADIALAAFVLQRLRARPSAPGEAKTGFDLSATSPVGGVRTHNPLDPADPDVAVPPGAVTEIRPDVGATP